MNKENNFFKIIDEICEEKQIKQQLLSYGWIRKLEKNDQIHYIINYQFDLNSETSFKIAGDKFATYEILKNYNIPTITHKIVFNPKTRSGYYKDQFISEAKEMLKENNNKIVVKANDSCQGKDVFYCSTNSDIEKIIRKLFLENNDTLSVCPYLDIDYEYRTVYLDGEILYVYKKRKAYVVGDGKKSVNELIKEKENKENIKIDLSPNINLNYIPQKNEEYTVSWKHNLNGGAVAIEINDNDEFLEKVKNISKDAGKTIGITFATIDVAVASNKEIFVMEINSSVCMNKFSKMVLNGYDISKNIYEKAINKMFEK